MIYVFCDWMLKHLYAPPRTSGPRGRIKVSSRIRFDTSAVYRPPKWARIDCYVTRGGVPPQDQPYLTIVTNTTNCSSSQISQIALSLIVRSAALQASVTSSAGGRLQVVLWGQGYKLFCWGGGGSGGGARVRSQCPASSSWQLRGSTVDLCAIKWICKLCDW